MAAPVVAHGGDILKFLGDGFFIATFPREGRSAAAVYGNIGALDRLDFTMVGPAINEASRMEALCKTLDVDILFSADFHAACDRPNLLAPVGCFTLRGVHGEREMFTLAA
jgi:adenylate cyclase